MEDPLSKVSSVIVEQSAADGGSVMDVPGVVSVVGDVGSSSSASVVIETIAPVAVLMGSSKGPMWAILILGVGCAILSELVQWYFLYRKEDYNNSIKSMKRLLGVIQAEGSSSQSSSKDLKKREKRLNDMKDKLNESIQAFSMRKMKYQGATSVLMLLTLPFIYRNLGGKVAGVLPFTPWTLLRFMSQQGLDKSAVSARQFSVVFIYFLSNTALKPLIIRLIGGKPALFDPKTIAAAANEVL